MGSGGLGAIAANNVSVAGVFELVELKEQEMWRDGCGRSRPVVHRRLGALGPGRLGTWGERVTRKFGTDPEIKRRARRLVAVLEKLYGRDAVPGNVRKLFPRHCSRDFVEGVLTCRADPAGVADAVDFVESRLGGARWRSLELRYGDRVVVIDGRERGMPPAEFAFYGLVVYRRVNGRGFVRWNTPGLIEEYLRHYWAATNVTDGNRERLGPLLFERDANPVRRARRRRRWFDERKSRVNGLVRSLGEWPGCDYGIVTRGKRPATRCGVIVDARCVRIRDGPSLDRVGAVDALFFGVQRGWCRRFGQRPHNRNAMTVPACPATARSRSDAVGRREALADLAAGLLAKSVCRSSAVERREHAVGLQAIGGVDEARSG